MSRVYIPTINPVKIFPKTVSRPAQYNTIPFDLQSYYSRIPDHYQKRRYSAKWQTTDAIRLQYRSNFNPIQIDIIDGYGISRQSVIMTQKQADAYNPGYYIYEADISLASIAPGCYTMETTFGSGGQPWTSEPLDIRDNHPHTVLLEYKGNTIEKDIFWLTGYAPMFRIEGRLGRLGKGSADVLYYDQPRNPTMINSVSFRKIPFHIGFTYGIPDWVYDRVSEMFGLESISIDGEYFSKAEEGAEFEETVIEQYPMRGFILEVTPSLNRSSIPFDQDINTNKKVAVVGNIETNLFGDLSSNAATNQVPVLNYE